MSWAGCQSSSTEEVGVPDSWFLILEMKLSAHQSLKACDNIHIYNICCPLLNSQLLKWYSIYLSSWLKYFFVPGQVGICLLANHVSHYSRLGALNYTPVAVNLLHVCQSLEWQAPPMYQQSLSLSTQNCHTNYVNSEWERNLVNHKGSTLQTCFLKCNTFNEDSRP